VAKIGEAEKGESRRGITEGKEAGFREKPPSASGLDRIDG